MNETIDKLRILRIMTENAFREWKKHVWPRDLDQPYCCDGRECGCGAITTRECYNWKIEQ